MFGTITQILVTLIMLGFLIQPGYAEPIHHSKTVHHSHHTSKHHKKKHHKKKTRPANHHSNMTDDDQQSDDDQDAQAETTVQDAKQNSGNQTVFASSTDCRDPAATDTADVNKMTPPDPLSKSVEKQVVAFVDKTVANLRYSYYKLGGKHFDLSRGIYVLDCSNFVDHILKETSPHAYSSLVSATGADAPASQHYYNFFTELSNDPDSYWNKVENVDELRPGDILVFRYKNRRGTETGGHVMVVMNKPIRDDDVFLVRVADSAPSGHSEDTRGRTSGIGIGTLLLKANSRTGEPSAYAWGLGGYWNKNVSIAMARPVDVG